MAKADGTIIINTKIDTDGIKEGIDETKKELDFGDVIKGSAIGSAVTTLVTEAISGIKDLGAQFIESAAEVKAEGSQFEQTFKDMGDAAKTAIGGIATESGILETRLNTLGSQIYAFAKSSGATSGEAMELMEGALRAAADGAAYYDRSLEDTTATLQSFLKGNYENDAALGVSATETTRNAAAMASFGKKFNDLTEIQKQQTLLKMVTDAQALSGAMGQASREADGWENVQGNLNESIRQFQAAAGQPFLNQLVPIVKGITTNITTLTKKTDWSAIDKGLNSMISAFKENGIKGLADTALPMINGFTKNLRTHAGKLVDSGLKLVVKLAKGLADSLPTLIKYVPKIVSNIAGIINDNAPKIITTAAKVIGTLAKGLIKAIPTLVKNIPSIIKAIIDVFTAYNWLKLGKTAITGIKNGIKAMKESIKTSAGTIKTSIYNAIKGLPAQLKTLGSNSVKGMRTAISNLLGSLKTTAGKILTNIVSAVKNLPSKLASKAKDAVTQMGKKFTSKGWKDIGKAIINGIISGISNASGQLFSTLKSMASDALNSVKSFFGIHSPSRVFRDEIGKMLPPGITEGLESAFPNTIKALKKQSGKLLDTASGMIPSILEYSMPVMASGTIIPPGAGTEPYNNYLGTMGEDIKALKALLLNKDKQSVANTAPVHVTAQINRRTLFDEFIEEAKIRKAQTGFDPLAI